MSQPVGRNKPFNIKECYVIEHVDNPNSIAGPTFGRYHRANCVKKVSVTNKENVVKQAGDGVGNCGVETYLEEAEVALTLGGRNDLMSSKIFNAAFWLSPGTSHYAYTSGATPNYVTIIARTDRVGTNGRDLWLIIYKAKFTGDGVNLEVPNFSNIEMKGTAEFTESRIPVVRDNLTVYERALWKVEEHATAQEINPAIADSTAITVSSSVPTLSPTVTDFAVANNLTVTLSEEPLPESINEYTVYVVETATPNVRIPAVVTISTSSPWVVTVNPTASLSATTSHKLIATTAVMDKAGNALATQYEAAFTTA